MAPEAVERRAGWRPIAEDTLRHRFTGDAVFLNDRLALVLRSRGAGAEVYARAAKGLQRRAVLAPRGARALAALTILENSPSAVMLEAAFKTSAGKTASVRLRLTAGEAFVEARAGQGADRLLVHCEARRVVVPDFFADDMVFGPETCQGARVGLPAENVVLNLIEGGDAIVMCVWQSNEQNADLLLTGERAKRRIRGCEIELAKGKSIWVACLEGSRLWQSRPLADEEGADALARRWAPPFPAKWRAVKGCGALVVYPLDRSRATPLTVLCPIDVMRNTLGVGPCQYVLAMEGLGTGGDPTPAVVASWIEKQFKRGRSRRRSAEIAERLGQMIRHVKHADARIGQYAAFGARVTALLGSSGARATRGIADELAASRPRAAPEQARSLAAAITALIGKENALPECQRLAGELRRVGAAQDRALARCRMVARRLKQWGRTTAAEPAAAELARAVQRMAEGMLAKKGDHR